jgi:hypothetical protein
VGIDTETGELHTFDSKKALEEAQHKNPSLEEITEEVYTKMVPLAPVQRLDAFKEIAGPNTSKQRRAKKLAKKMADESRRRNRKR